MAIPNVGSEPNHGLAPERPFWRVRPPVLTTARATLREVTLADARQLWESLGTVDVQRYLPVGATTPEGFERFIRWVTRERKAGRYLCFAVVPHDIQVAAGVFELWPVEPGFGTAEIGFALDKSLWGSGLFTECAAAVLDLAFERLGVRRMEARTAAANGRGVGALRKLGAVPEGTLRRCFRCPSGELDHVMWSLLADEWQSNAVASRALIS